MECSSSWLVACGTKEEGNKTAALWVNGEQVPVNMDRHIAEIRDFLKEGENTLTVRVSTSLRNKMLEVGYEQGWNIQTPGVADYGMTGETKLIVKR